MNLAVAVYSALLFVVLTPGVFLRLPSNGRKIVVAGVHSIVFAIVLYFTAGFIWRWSIGLGFEGFKGEKELRRERADDRYRTEKSTKAFKEEKQRNKKKH